MKNKDIRRYSTGRLHAVRTTQIEFKKECEYCNTVYWSKSKRGRFCCASCRVSSHNNNKNEK